MYLLTDYPEDHLRIFSRMTADRIEDVLYNRLHSIMPESSVMWDAELTALREHHVHLLTALQIVKDRELTIKN